MTQTPACQPIQASFSAYLDGAVSGREMQRIAEHLDACATCSNEFSELRAMQNTLSMLKSAKAPVDLGLKLRLAISRERSKRSTSLFDTFSTYWDNTARPLLIQVSAGFAVAMVLLVAVGFLFSSVVVPSAVRADDEPMAAVIAPHYLYSSDQARPILTTLGTTIVVEAKINEEGRVYDYAIVSDPQSPAVQTQIEGQLLLSVFGSPVRGRVVLTYDGVSVHG